MAAPSPVLCIPKIALNIPAIVPQYGLTLTARYFLVQEHALVVFSRSPLRRSTALPVTCYVMHLHTHNPYTSRSGSMAVCSQGPQEGLPCLVLPVKAMSLCMACAAADGSALAFGEMGYTVSLAEAAIWARGDWCTTPAYH